MSFTIKLDREDDGRWIAEVTDLPGVLDQAEIGPRLLARIAKWTGLRPEDL